MTEWSEDMIRAALDAQGRIKVPGHEGPGRRYEERPDDPAYEMMLAKKRDYSRRFNARRRALRAERQS